MSQRILVVCTGNRCRSQMAHGWLQSLLGDDAIVQSAGTEPKGVHPKSILAMAEVGIDISGHTSDHISQYLGEDWDLVVTVCDSAKETCPVVPGARNVIHHSFDDPDDETLTEDQQWALFRRVRDEIGEWAQEFAQTN
ncbi:MAG: arsenate reductase ArsC [Acidimicrobiia bacterium]|nr:arsenate reductase ArsC [Acidimicrobiia bacterium]